jgi:hypothetical protein
VGITAEHHLRWPYCDVVELRQEGAGDTASPN